MCLNELISHHPFLSLINILMTLFPPLKFPAKKFVKQSCTTGLIEVFWLIRQTTAYLFKLSLEIHLCKWEHHNAEKNEVISLDSIRYLTACFYSNKWYTASILNHILTEVISFCNWTIRCFCPDKCSVYGTGVVLIAIDFSLSTTFLKLDRSFD